MKRAVICLVLVLLLMLAFTACAGPQVENPTDPIVETTAAPTLPSFEAEEPSVKDNVYQIYEPKHLLYLAEHPDKDYALCADIDMYGYEWTPVDTFSGNLTGLIYDVYNYTISNLTIQAAAGDADVGIFRTVSGTVQDINFDNVTVTVSGTFSGNLGVVAGQITTDLTDVDVTNSVVTVSAKDANVGLICGKASNSISGGSISGGLNVTLSGGKTYVGGAVGYTENTVMDEDVRTNLNVTGSGAGASGGVVGYLSNTARTVSFGGKLNINTDSAHAAGALAGEVAAGGITASYNCARQTNITGAVSASEYVGIQASGATVNTCVTRDLSNLDEKLPAAEQAMRQKVVDYMYKLCTVRWVPTQEIVHTDECTDDSHQQTYKAGQLYIGLPYAHTSNSLDKFMAYLNENGTLKDEAYAAVGTDAPNGLPIKDVVDFIGNDCADAVYWAWAQVCGDICFTLTDNVLADGAIVPVGDYEIGGNITTAPIIAQNGAQKMFEAYAKVQMGDGLLFAPGHARMAAEAAYVFRNENGSIDPYKSYIIVHEQGGWIAKLDTRHTTCNTYTKYTFAKLFQTKYIPITVPNFAQAKADTLTASATNTDQSKTGLGAGEVSANFRLERVTVKITDSTGKAVLDTFCHPVYGDHDMADHVTKQDLAVFADAIAAANLEAGKEYTYSVYVSAGEQEVCAQTFKFTA